MNQQNSKQNISNKFLTNFLLGSVSGAISYSVLYPIDRVKIIITVQYQNPKIQLEEIPPYKGIFDCFQRVVKEEGLRALWIGNLSNVMRYFPTQALNFSFNDYYKKIYCPYNAKKEPIKYIFGNIVSGGVAGATSQCFLYPLYNMNIKVAEDIGSNKQRQFSGQIDCFKKIVKNEGLKVLYKGFAAQVSCNIIYRGIYFGLFDSAKGFGLGQQNLFFKFLLAYSATQLANLISYPLDTVRRRLMMQQYGDKIYNGMVDCFIKIYQNEGGSKAFFRGAGSYFLRGLKNTIVLVIYDAQQQQLQKKQY